MDWKYIVGIAAGAILIILIIGAIVVHLKKKNKIDKKVKEIGQTSEDRINRDLKVWAKKTKNYSTGAQVYKYNKNIVFEVDSILVTSQAIIVVEMKSISGDITGVANEANWVKTMGTKQHKIKSPIEQNDKHIKHVLKMLQQDLPIISMIVFSDRADKLVIKGVSGHTTVIKHNAMFRELDTITKSLPVKFNDYDKKALIKRIDSFKGNKADIKLHKKITGAK